MKAKYYIHSLLAILFLGLILNSCEMVAPDTPDCILEKIDALKDTSIDDYRAQVLEYSYRGYLVYYIPQLGPDEYSDLYDMYCNLICHPDGGPSGNGDGSCSDFLSDANFVRMIWQD